MLHGCARPAAACSLQFASGRAYLTHLPKMMADVGILPSCWVLERKHKGVKRYANGLTNSSCPWDRSVLRDVTVGHLEELTNDHFGVDAGRSGEVQPHKVKVALRGIHPMLCTLSWCLVAFRPPCVHA